MAEGLTDFQMALEVPKVTPTNTLPQGAWLLFWHRQCGFCLLRFQDLDSANQKPHWCAFCHAFPADARRETEQARWEEKRIHECSSAVVLPKIGTFIFFTGCPVLNWTRNLRWIRDNCAKAEQIWDCYFFPVSKYILQLHGSGSNHYCRQCTAAGGVSILIVCFPTTCPFPHSKILKVLIQDFFLQPGKGQKPMQEKKKKEMKNRKQANFANPGGYLGLLPPPPYDNNEMILNMDNRLSAPPPYDNNLANMARSWNDVWSRSGPFGPPAYNNNFQNVSKSQNYLNGNSHMYPSTYDPYFGYLVPNASKAPFPVGRSYGRFWQVTLQSVEKKAVSHQRRTSRHARLDARVCFHPASTTLQAAFRILNDNIVFNGDIHTTKKCWDARLGVLLFEMLQFILAWVRWFENHCRSCLRGRWESRCQS